jgi:hypothetical protein
VENLKFPAEMRGMEELGQGLLARAEPAGFGASELGDEAGGVMHEERFL